MFWLVKLIFVKWISWCQKRRNSTTEHKRIWNREVFFHSEVLEEAQDYVSQVLKKKRQDWAHSFIRARGWTGFRFPGQNWIGQCNPKERGFWSAHQGSHLRGTQACRSWKAGETAHHEGCWGSPIGNSHLLVAPMAVIQCMHLHRGWYQFKMQHSSHVQMWELGS